MAKFTAIDPAYRFYEIKLKGGKVKFEEGEAVITEELAEELRKHPLCGGTFKELAISPWVEGALKGGDVNGKEKEEQKEERTEVLDEELEHVVEEGGEEQWQKEAESTTGQESQTAPTRRKRPR